MNYQHFAREVIFEKIEANKILLIGYPTTLNERKRLMKTPPCIKDILMAEAGLSRFFRGCDFTVKNWNGKCSITVKYDVAVIKGSGKNFDEAVEAFKHNCHQHFSQPAK